MTLVFASMGGLLALGLPIAFSLGVAALIFFLAVLVAGALGVAVMSLGSGLLPMAEPPSDAGLRAATWDIDSRVALRARASCAPRVAALTLLSDRGAAPRLGSDGASIWFEARAEDGRFQIHRVRVGEPARCWTCGEPGDNRRPAPHPRGESVLFDSDRFASWRGPNDTELMVVSGRGEEGPRHPSRRLSYRAGPDDHAFYDPSGSGLDRNTTCYDMAYGIGETPFTQWARDRGVTRVAQGWGMLVEQAAEAFFVWRDMRPQTRPVLEALHARAIYLAEAARTRS